MLLTLLFILLSLDLLLLLLLLAFGLLLLVLFLAFRLLLLLLWLRFLLLLLRFRLLLLCRLCLFFLFLRFGLFLLCSRFSLFLMLCWLSALVVVLFLCERRKIRSEKQKQGRCADDSKCFHECCLHLPPIRARTFFARPSLSFAFNHTPLIHQFRSAQAPIRTWESE